MDASAHVHTHKHTMLTFILSSIHHYTLLNVVNGVCIKKLNEPLTNIHHIVNK